MLFYMDLLDLINVTQSFLCHGPCDCNVILCALLLFWNLVFKQKILKHNSHVFKYNSYESNININKWQLPKNKN